LRRPLPRSEQIRVIREIRGPLFSVFRPEQIRAIREIRGPQLPD
jgi:hypothetical protein